MEGDMENPIEGDMDRRDGEILGLYQTVEMDTFQFTDEPAFLHKFIGQLLRFSE